MQVVQARPIDGWISDRHLNPKFDLDRIARFLGVESLEEMDDKYWAEYEPDNPEDEDLTFSERDDAWTRYQSALISCAEKLMADHGLVLKRQGESLEWVVEPKTSWSDAANEIRKTVNGVGYFYFSSLDEFLDSGPYTPRSLVLTHLHWLKRHPEVYEGITMRRIFDKAVGR